MPELETGNYDTTEELIEAIKICRFRGLTGKEVAKETGVTVHVLARRVAKYKIPMSPTIIPKLKDGKPTKDYMNDMFYFDKKTKRLHYKLNSNNQQKMGDLVGVEQAGHIAIKIGNITYSSYQLVILMNDGYLPSDSGYRVFSKSGKLDMSYDNLEVKSDVDIDGHTNRKKDQTPKDVNKKLMTAIWKNCPKGWHVDHIIPLIHGGLNEPDNLQYLTQEDNLKKGSKLDYQYITPPIRWQDVINEEDNI